MIKWKMKPSVSSLVSCCCLVKIFSGPSVHVPATLRIGTMAAPEHHLFHFFRIMFVSEDRGEEDE